MSVVIHVGQCGNQLGEAFWRLAADASEAAAVDATQTSGSSAKKTNAATASSSARDAGTRASPPPPLRASLVLPTLYADCLFHLRSRRARCILVDTEPKAIRSVLRGSASTREWRFVPAHVHHEQSGRGNNWAMGYNFQSHQRNVLRSKGGVSCMSYGGIKKKLLVAAQASVGAASDKRELVELVMETLRHEIEALNTYRGTTLMHSLGGGTGAGLGCRLLETIRDVYPRSYLGAVSVAPSCASGDTPLQHYNALFTLRHLQEHTDYVLYKENDELLKAVAYWKSIAQANANDAPSPRNGDGTSKVTLPEMNAVVGVDVAGLMFPIVTKSADRGLVARPFDMAKLVHDCCPLPAVKFLDSRTGILRTKAAKSTKAGPGNCEPLFLAVTSSHSSADADETMVQKLVRFTAQSFPRSASSSSAIGASAIVRHAGAPPSSDPRHSESLFHGIITAGLPRLHLGNTHDIVESRFAPFRYFGGKASTTITLNNGHAVRSIRHYLDRGRRQFEARAYTHWYKQYGLEDADFECAFEDTAKIVRNYDELLKP